MGARLLCGDWGKPPALVRGYHGSPAPNEGPVKGIMARS